MSQISSSLSSKIHLSLQPRGSPSHQRIFSLICLIFTFVLFVIGLFGSMIVQIFVGCWARIPVLIACTIRKERLSGALSIWGICCLVVTTILILVFDAHILDPNIVINFIITFLIFIGSYIAHVLYSPVIQNEKEITALFQEKLKEVKSRGIGRFGINVEALQRSDQIGVTKILSVRSASFVSCLAPFVLVLLSRTSNFEIHSCYSLDEQLIDNSYCYGNMMAAGISLKVYFWQLPAFVIAEIFIIRATALVLIFNFLREILLLHKYKAKFLGAGIQFISKISYGAVIEDYFWNFQAIFFLSFLEYIVPSDPSIKGLTPTGEINVYLVNNIISLNDTNPPGQGFYAYLYTGDATSNELWTFAIFIWTILVNCSFIVSIYGYYLNSINSALLTFFHEQEIIMFARKWQLKIRYEITSSEKEILTVIRHLHKKFKTEKIEYFVETMLIILDEQGVLKKIQE